MDNPWLSEFERLPWVRQQFQREWPLAVAFSLIATGSLLLGSIAGVNCLHASIEFIDTATNSTQRAASVTFGYLGELNHGIFYLVGIPLLSWLAFRFLNQTRDSISSLANMKQFQIDIEPNSPPQTTTTTTIDSEIAYRNKRTFVPLAAISLILSFTIIFGTELTSRTKRVFGWVQADHYRELNNVSLTSLDGGPIPAAEAYALEKLYKGTKANISQISSQEVHKLRTLLVVKLPGGSNLENTQPPSHSDSTFPLFLYTALATESFSIAFLIWISLKAVFVSWFLVSARWEARFRGQPLLVHKPRLCRWREAFCPKASSARISFILNDGKRARYGLQDIDPIYNLFLIIGMTGSVVYLLGRVSNFSKGTSWISTQGLDFIGQLLIALLVGLPILVILFFPVLGIATITHRAKKQALVIIENEIGEALLVGDEAKRARLAEEKDEVNNNSVWPLRGKKNIAVASTCLSLFMLAVPIRTIQEFMNPNDHRIAKTVQAVAEKVPEKLCSRGQ